MQAHGPVDPERAQWFGLAYAACFGVATSLVSCALVVAARSGLESPPLLAPACALVFAAAAFAPFALPGRARSALRTVPWAAPLVTLAVLLSPVLGLADGSALLAVWALLVGIGAPRAAASLRGISAAEAAFLALGPLLLATYAFLEFHGRPYAHVYAPEFANLGGLSLDTLFHAAMSHMLQSFGRPSTGVDGLVPIRYHLGSHAWFAGMGRVAHGTPPLFSYPYGQLGVAIPGLFLSLFLATLLLARSAGSVAIRIALAASLVIVSDRVGWNSYYISESYTFGLVALLLGLPLLIDSASGRWPRAERARTAAQLALVLVAVCLKVSVGVVLGACVGWTTLRRHRFSLATLVVGSALAAIAAFAWWAVKPVTNLSISESFSFLHFYRGPGVIGMSRLAGFTSPLLPLLYLLSVAWRLRRPEPAGAIRLASARRAELLGVGTVVALLPGLWVVMWSGTAWWFANVAHWIAVPLLVAELPLERLGPGRRRSVAVALAAFLTVWMATAARDVRPQRVASLARQLLARAGVDAPRHRADPGAIWGVWRASLATDGTLFGPELRERLARSDGARIARQVGRALDEGGREGLVVFVPPDNAAVWQTGDWRCFKRPFLIPALTGVPMLKGLAPGCALVGHLRGYGFGDYGGDSRSVEAEPLELCAHAAQRGFHRILVLSSLRSSHPNPVLECRGFGASRRP